jgi:hypothetical protein
VWWCVQSLQLFVRYNANGKIIEGPAFFNVSLAFRCFFFFSMFDDITFESGEAFFLEADRRITKSVNLSFVNLNEITRDEGTREDKRVFSEFSVSLKIKRI